MHDGWCCKQNALALASPRPHCSRRHVSPATNATAPHTLTHTAHVFQNPAFHQGRKKLSACTASSGVTYENEHCAPDGLPARQTVNATHRTRAALVFPISSAGCSRCEPTILPDSALGQPQRLPPGIATPMAPPRGHPPDNTPTLIIAYIYQGPSKMFGRLCAPCLHFG